MKNRDSTADVSTSVAFFTGRAVSICPAPFASRIGLACGLAFLLMMKLADAVPPSERAALLDLYNQTHGNQWVDSTGWLGAPGSECGWYGVICVQGKVTGLNLGGNNLTGPLPDLSALTELQDLWLSNNKLSGELPTLIGFSHLRNIVFRDNLLVGHFPAWNAMAPLIAIDAGNNAFDGALPDLNGTPTLQSAKFDGNFFSGQVPSLTGLVALETFAADSNQLTGPLPALAGLPSLASFTVSGNSLSGPIPPIAASASLKVFDVSTNQLTGSLPSTYPNLQVFNASNNNLGGAMPSLASTQIKSWRIDGNVQLGGQVAAGPNPNTLVPTKSSLCPSNLKASGVGQVNAQWNTATGHTPWDFNDGCVHQPVSMIAPHARMTFIPPNVVIGGSFTMRVTIDNPNSEDVTGLDFTDVHPAGLQNGAIPDPILENTCGGLSSAPTGGGSLSLNGGVVPARGSCTITMMVSAILEGTWLSSSGPMTSLNAPTSVGANAALTVVALAAPTADVDFVPASVALGGTSQLVITLTNSDSTFDVVGVQFTDNYPTPLHMANAANGAVLVNGCGGTLDAPPNGTHVSLSGGRIPANSSCTIKIQVTGTSLGVSENHIGVVTSLDAEPGADAFATLTVTNLPAPTVSKTFAPSSIEVGESTVMSIKLTNNDPSQAITGAAFSDSYPAPLHMTNAPDGLFVANDCGGTWSAQPMDDFVSLNGGIVPAGQSCTIKIRVIGVSVGTSQNHTGAVTSSNADPGLDAIGILDVVSSPPRAAPTATKVFAPPNVPLGSDAVMIITLTNHDASHAITGVAFTDNYPLPLHMANAPFTIVLANTCAGILSAPPNGTSVTLTGGVIPANSACMVKVRVVGTSPGSSVNHTGPISSTNAGPGVDATGTLTVTSGALLTSPTVTKAFVPASVTSGGVSQMTIGLANNDASSAITGLRIDDIYPVGMVNDGPGSPVISDTCSFNEDVPAGGHWAKLSNGSIGPNAQCEIVIKVVGSITATNSTGLVSSDNAQNGISVSAALTVGNAPIGVGDAIEVASGGSTSALVGDSNVPNSLLDNDFDLDPFGTLAAVKVFDPTHGSVSVGPDGQFVYQNDGTGSADSFAYKACDSDNLCSPDTKVTITIGGSMDNHVPYAVDDAIYLGPGGTANSLVGDTNIPNSVLDNDGDPDDDILTASMLTAPSHGDLILGANGTFGYHNTDPAAANDQFFYETCDAGGACAHGKVTITIQAGASDRLPIVVDDAIQVNPGDTTRALIGDMNIPASVLDNDTDPDGDVLNAVLLGGLLNQSGVLTFGVDGTFTYQNTDLSAAADEFVYEACDGSGACVPGTVSLSIGVDALDSLPVAAGDAIIVAPHGTANTLVGDPNTPSSVLTNDHDPDSGDALSALLISPPSNGAITLNADGTFVYVNTDPSFDDEFQYEACDKKSACAAATVTITVNHDAPTVACVLPKQVDVVGDTVSLNLSLLFTAPLGQSMTFGGANLPPSLSIVGSLLAGTLQASDQVGSPYASTLTATVTGGGSANENVIFQVLPTGEILMRDGFDGQAAQPCQ